MEYELRWGMLEGRGVQGGGGIKAENWENCNSIINKIYLKIKNKTKQTKQKKNFGFESV